MQQPEEVTPVFLPGLTKDDASPISISATFKHKFKFKYSLIIFISSFYYFCLLYIKFIFNQILNFDFKKSDNYPK